jgi:soluble lytic murein transglycosylase-like protein
MPICKSFLRILLFSLFAFLPVHFFFPSQLKGPARLEDLAKFGSLGREILRIYSFIKLNRADLEESPAWAMAKTIVRESKNNAVDPMLVVALIDVESQFRPEAVSEKGARGLMQIRPEAAAELAQKPNPEAHLINSSANPSLLHDPTTNIKIGVSYLGYLQKRFRDLKLALMAYNCGPTKVQKTLDENEVIPQDYALKVLSTYHSYRTKKVTVKYPWKAA